LKGKSCSTNLSTVYYKVLNKLSFGKTSKVVLFGHRNPEVTIYIYFEQIQNVLVFNFFIRCKKLRKIQHFFFIIIVHGMLLYQGRIMGVSEGVAAYPQKFWLH